MAERIKYTERKSPIDTFSPVASQKQYKKQIDFAVFEPATTASPYLLCPIR